MFRVGQKVVCVDAQTIPPGGFPRLGIVVEGAIYTVREVGLTVRRTRGIRLLEVDLTGDEGDIGIDTFEPLVDCFYRATRFRPIVEKKTDISTFTALLNTKQRENILCGND